MAINAVLAGLWLSGSAWLVCRYFLRAPGEWGPEPNPMEPWWMRLHGLFAFLALWGIGFLSGAHIVGGWMTGRRRATGLTLISTVGLMAVTAWLLLWGTDDGPFAAVSPVHWVVGLALPAFYLMHRKVRAAPVGRLEAGASPADKGA